MGLFQLLEMDKVPASAAVNESVKLVRERLGEGLTGYVNAVLRAAARKTDWREPEGAAALSLPEELYGYLTALYGRERTEAAGKAFLRAPALWMRLEQSRVSRAAAEESLKADGFRMPADPDIPGAVRLERAEGAEEKPLEACEAVKKGWLQPQDISSQLAVTAAAPKAGMRILDMCAAPGGKSLHAADLMNDDGLILACDIRESKLRLIRENADRAGFSSVKTALADAEVFDPEKEEHFDLVIADLPCSGLGVASRKPEIKYRVSEKQVKELAALQRRMLANAVRYVKPGGKLLYSTCTITKEENADNALYIEQTLGLKPCPLALPLSVTGGRTHTLQLLPGDRDGDGFFISLFEKEKRE